MGKTINRLQHSNKTQACQLKACQLNVEIAIYKLDYFVYQPPFYIFAKICLSFITMLASYRQLIHETMCTFITIPVKNVLIFLEIRSSLLTQIQIGVIFLQIWEPQNFGSLTLHINISKLTGKQCERQVVEWEIRDKPAK